MKKFRVLLIEDNCDIAELYLAILASANFMTRLAQNGQTALKILQQHQFELILLDLILPDVDGLSLLKQLHQQHLLRHHGPVLVLTNLSDPATIVELENNGAEKCFLKTELNPDDFLELVQTYCDNCYQLKT